jgi:hypothetical protein
MVDSHASLAAEHASAFVSLLDAIRDRLGRVRGVEHR